ncbi:MAG: hypothetical protein M0D54_07325 [Hyphomonadaceae bacterium JAD_PAG50586_4]|nr:MAG: hypothetical protein M0D54_07325 [Hyphomonadaceae bacterium JAD_PAG50586_4]
MRAIMAAAAFGLMSAMAAPALAQSGDDYSGTWAFQTEPYGDEQFGVLMSGAAIVQSSGRNRYQIQLLSNEIIIERQTARSSLVSARQNCTGVVEDGQINIDCELAEPVEGYQPDNFVLQRSSPTQLQGVLASAASAQVTFNRVR